MAAGTDEYVEYVCMWLWVGDIVDIGQIFKYSKKRFRNYPFPIKLNMCAFGCGRGRQTHIVLEAGGKVEQTNCNHGP